MGHREVPREMSNHSTQSFGGGSRPGLRSLGIGRGAGPLCLVLGLLVFASSAMAAEIVEVRVGRHAEFTRIVFELDRAAGYRIERANPSSDVAELVVSLEATSIPRRIQSSKSLIKQVQIEPAGKRSVARIRLSKRGLKLKEMILASPPRIVLDVLSDQPARPAVAATAKTKPKASESRSKTVETAKAKTQANAEKSFDDVIAKLPTKSAAAPTPSKRPSPSTSASGSSAALAKAAEPVVEKVEKVAVAEATKVEAVIEKVVPGSNAPSGGSAVGGEPSTSTPMDEMERDGRAALADAGSTGAVVPETAPTPAPKARPAPRTMVVQSKPVKDEGSGWMIWALAGVGVVLLLLGGLLVAKRRSGGDEVDFANESDSDDGDSTQTGSDENPFGGLGGDGEQMTLGSSGEAAGSSLGTASGDTTIVSLPDDEKESESVVFGDSEEKTMEDMEVISRDQVNESLGGMPPVGGGIPEEFQQMMREMNRRVETLEGRIDELVDARDRLERQVAAQTEELRVQRAAIARTQRAVRNLARPEDEEQEPTEPALRDPNQPSSD